LLLLIDEYFFAFSIDEEYDIIRYTGKICIIDAGWRLSTDFYVSHPFSLSDDNDLLKEIERDITEKYLLTKPCQIAINHIHCK